MKNIEHITGGYFGRLHYTNDKLVLVYWKNRFMGNHKFGTGFTTQGRTFIGYWVLKSPEDNITDKQFFIQ